MYNVAICGLDDVRRREALLAELVNAGLDVEMLDAVPDSGAPISARIDALIVGREANPAGQDPLAWLKWLGDADIAVVLEQGLLGDEIQAPTHEWWYYVVDDLLAPDSLSTLMAGVRQSRTIRDLKSDILNRTSAIGMIESGRFRFRTMREARNLATMLSIACNDPGRVLVGLTELLVNAVEHGNLGISHDEKRDLLAQDAWEDEIEKRLADPELSHRSVTVAFERVGEGCRFDIADEGAGFDPSAFLEFDPSRMMQLNGRGIAIACSMGFDDVRYVGRGNRVIATIHDGVQNAAVVTAVSAAS